jgi:hypothetical protein
VINFFPMATAEKKRLEEAGQIFNEKDVPGRMYSFMAVK